MGLDPNALGVDEEVRGVEEAATLEHNPNPIPRLNLTLRHTLTLTPTLTLTLIPHPNPHPTPNQAATLEHNVPMWKYVLAGGGSGCCSTCVLTPVELVKCRLQAQIALAPTPTLTLTLAPTLTLTLPLQALGFTTCSFDPLERVWSGLLDDERGSRGGDDTGATTEAQLLQS